MYREKLLAGGRHGGPGAGRRCGLGFARDLAAIEAPDRRRGPRRFVDTW